MKQGTGKNFAFFSVGHLIGLTGPDTRLCKSGGSCGSCQMIMKNKNFGAYPPACLGARGYSLGKGKMHRNKPE